MFALGFLGVGLGPLDCSGVSTFIAAVTFVGGGDEMTGFGDGNGATLTGEGSDLVVDLTSLEVGASVAAEFAFGVRLFGPLALLFVAWVNSTPSELGLLSWVLVEMLALGALSSAGRGLPLRDKMPARAGFKRAASLLFSGNFALKLVSIEDGAFFSALTGSGFVLVLRSVVVALFSETGVDTTFELIDSSESDFVGNVILDCWAIGSSFFNEVGLEGRTRDSAGAADLSSMTFLISIFSVEGPVLCNAIRLASASGTGSDGFAELRDSGRLPIDPLPAFMASFFCRMLSLNSSIRLLGCGPPVTFNAAFP